MVPTLSHDNLGEHLHVGADVLPPLRQSHRATVMITRFDVRAQAEPAALVRLLDLFAQRSMLPTSVSAHVLGDELYATITLPDIGAATAANLCARMRNMIAVHAATVDHATCRSAAA